MILSLFDQIEEQVASAVLPSPRAKFLPRDYQQLGIDHAFQLWAEGHVGVLFRQPTGTGKTVSGSLIADLWLQRGHDHRVLVLAHERQLIQQFADEIQEILGIVPGIEMGDLHCTGNEQIIVGSRQTLYVKGDGEETVSRLYKFRPDLKWLLVIDEGHRWRRGMSSARHIIEWFEQNPDHRRLLLTATPERSDKTAILGTDPKKALCTGVASDYRLFDVDGGPCAVNDGWAVPYDQRYIVVDGVDFKNLKEVAKDFDKNELERILGETETLAKLCDPLLDIVGRRRTIVFNPGTAMARDVALYINSKMGYEAAVTVDGSYPDEQRKEIYKRHQRGDVQFLSVCGLCIAEGTLILTDRGEIPIEQVTTEMRLWDGVEYVSHNGIIAKGVQPVIQYAGLAATGDHNVWTDRGWERFAACKQQRTAIRVSGIGGTAVRESDRYYRDDHSHWKESASRLGSSVRRVRQAVRQVLQRTEDGAVWLQELHEKFRRSGLAADALSFGKEAVRESARRLLSGLWGARNRVPVLIADGDGLVDHGESWGVQGTYSRSQGQWQALRAGQHSLGITNRAGEQSKIAPLRLQATVEVFDILNAGPRHRFTANGLIVSNCREGYNDPGIQCVAVFRPTKSRSLAEQMKGRGCRPLRGVVSTEMTPEERRRAIAASDKAHCLVVDLVGVSGLGDVPSTASLMAEGKPDEVIERANAAMLAKPPGEASDVAKEIRKAEAEIAEEARVRREEEMRKRQAEMDRRAKLQAKARYRENKVRSGEGGVGGVRAHMETTTPKQANYLARFCNIEYEVAIRMAKNQASAIIGRHKSGTPGPKTTVIEPGRPCNPNQSHVLERYGLPTNVTYEQAADYMRRINAGEFKMQKKG